MKLGTSFLPTVLFGLFFLISVCDRISAEDLGIVTCSFSKDLCGWRQEAGRSFSWRRVRAAQVNGKPVTATSTSTDDFFLYANGGDSQLLEHSNLAVLHSVEFYNPGAGALRFWHVSESASAPGLYVNVTQRGSSTTIKKFRGFAHHWTERVVNVAEAGRTVLTVASAPVGHAIDELEYTRDAEVAVFREVIVPFPRPLVRDAEVSCSFSKDFCGWSPYPGLLGSWSRVTGPTSPPSFVQNSSNPWLDSFFLSVQETEDYGDEGVQAAIITRSIRQNTSSWLSFWWAKYEEAQEESAIFVKIMTEDGPTETVFYSKLPAHGWVSQNVSIPHFPGRSRILIGFLLKKQNSTGVLDEIQFSADLQGSDELTTIGPEGSGYGTDSKEFLF